MELLLQPLRDLEAFQILKEKMKKGQGPFAVGGITEEQKVHFLYALTAEEPKQRLIVTYNEWQAAE